MRLATNKEVLHALRLDHYENVMSMNENLLKTLGLDHYENVMSITVTIKPLEVPKAIITVPIIKRETDWLSIINSGKSHSKVLAMVEAAE